MTDDLPEIFDDTTDTQTDQPSETMSDSREHTHSDERTDEGRATTDEPPETTGAVTGPQDTAFDPLELFDHQRHRTNGDETIVVLSSFGRGYQAIAYDVDKAGEVLEVEVIGDAEDKQSAESMCKYWTQQNPKGVLGGPEGDGDGGGFLAKLGFGGGGE